MFIDFLYGIIGIFILTAYCIPGEFLVPKIAFYLHYDNVNDLLQETVEAVYKDLESYYVDSCKTTFEE